MKKIRLIFTSLLVVLLGVYAFGAYYYSQHTFPQTKYRGNTYGDMTKEELKKNLDNNETTDIVLNEDSYTEVIPGKEVGFTHKYDLSNFSINKNFLLWPLELSKSHDLGDIPYSSSFNEELLKEKIRESNLATNIKREPSKDAQVVQGDGKYVVAPESYGNTLDVDKLVNSVVSDVNNKKTTVDVKAMGPYVQPKIFKDDKKLQEEVEFKNRWEDTDIQLNLAGKKIPVIDWTTDNGYRTNKEENFEEHNLENTSKFVESLAEKYDTVNLERKFKNSHGDTITLEPGTFGYEIDQEALAQLINDNLSRGNKTVIDVPFINEGRDIDDDQIGDTYVEIDLSTQQVFVYQNGEKVIDSLVVSGNSNIAGRETPTGTFYVIGKSTNTDLVSTVPGDEYTAYVNFWMPFTPEQHGLHDAGWISDFGGELYESVGSHGCVNMMYDDAAKVYDIVKYGTPVVIYKSGLPPTKTYYEQLYEQENSGSDEEV